MATSFWNTLKKPIFALAPMADVTDAAFRRIIARIGKPDVMWTEFVSADGLCSPGRTVLLRDLWFDASERPIVAQFFGANPAHFYEVAQLAQELGFDGIDINMGCPQDKVVKQCAGADLIRNPKLARTIIRETKRGAGPLPVSVKTRIGYRENDLREWLPQLLAEEPAAIIIHARTKKEMSKVPARWDAIGEAVALVHRAYARTPEDRPRIIGNGDVKTLAEAETKVRDFGVDGVMIGRGIFTNPWLFNPAHREPSVAERITLMLEHMALFESLYGEKKHFATMKKHFKSYIYGFPGAAELREKLMQAESPADVRAAADAYGLTASSETA